MRGAAKIIAWTALAIGVLIPVAAWWADSSNRRHLTSWFSSPPKQQEEEGGIRVHADPTQVDDVGAALDMWAWRFRIDIPPESPWKHGWLVVKKKGETAMVFDAGPIEWSNGRPKTWHCIVSVTPTEIGAGVFSAERVAIRANGNQGSAVENPFKLPAPAIGQRSPKPKFFGNQAILAAVRKHGTGGIRIMDSEDDLKWVAEGDAALLLVLTESFEPPPIT